MPSGKVLSSNERGKDINKVLALIVDMDNDTLSILIDRLQQEYYRRKSGPNFNETVQL